MKKLGIISAEFVSPVLDRMKTFKPISKQYVHENINAIFFRKSLEGTPIFKDILKPWK